jgi:hypothetical protein
VTYKPLINPEQVYLPSLHIKLQLMKILNKAVDQIGMGLLYLKEYISNGDTKIKERTLQVLK